MSTIVVQHGGQQRGRMFGAAAVGTLALGVGAALLVIFHFRAPPPVVVQSPPEIKVVEKEKTVYVPQASAAPRATPEPPPPPPPPPAPEPPPTTATVVVKSVWDGVWRRKEHPLPMFRLSQSGDTVAGACDPSWNVVVPFRDGEATENAVQFVVDDQMFRVHVRMTMTGEDKAKVEQWVSDSDLETAVERVSKMAKTPQQARLARAILEKNARDFRKPVTVGVFTRQAAE